VPQSFCLFWLALATRSKHLGAGGPRLARRKVSIDLKLHQQEDTVHTI
jgi:hypothetical protein